MDTVQTSSTALIRKRIEAIIQELHELQSLLVAQEQPCSKNLAANLFGALGTGTWEEYDVDLDWKQSEL